MEALLVLCSYSVPLFPPSLPVRRAPASRDLSRAALPQRVSLVDWLVEGIAQFVISRQLQDGDPLPSQDEMARQFGVSRLSVREAVNRMEALGVVVARQGRGTFVKDPSGLTEQARAITVPDYPTVAGLFITLYEVEPAVAALAAINADGPGVSALRDCLCRGKAASEVRDLPGFLAHDLRFHSAIAELSRNSILAQTVGVARGLLDEAIAASMVVLPTDLDTCATNHERVADAVFSGDARSAYRAMQAEIDHILGHNVELIRELADAGA